MKKFLISTLNSILFFSFLIDNDAYAKRYRYSNKNSLTTPSENLTKPAKEFIKANYGVLLDFDTGEVLFSKNADKPFRPASMTKLMTVYVVFCALRDGKIHLDDEFPVSMKAQRMEGSRSFFRAGTFAKVEDLVKSIIIHSGNDACIIIAEGLYGDESAFVDEMNKKAEEFGLQNTHFQNTHGLTSSEHISSAYDLAIIAKRIIEDFPQFYKYFSQKSFTINGITQPNRNVLLGNSLGVDGLKTGHTEASGWGIVVSAKKNGKRLISVVNGCASESVRALDSNKLLTMGFRQFSNIKIAIMNQPITVAKVWMGVKNEVSLCTHEDIIVHVPDKYKKSVIIEAKLFEPVEAPIFPGMKIGKLTYKFGNFVSKEFDLFACEHIERLGIFGRAIFSLNHLIFGSSTTPKFLAEDTEDEKISDEKNNLSTVSENISQKQPLNLSKFDDTASVKKEDPFLWRKNVTNVDAHKNLPSIATMKSSENLAKISDTTKIQPVKISANNQIAKNFSETNRESIQHQDLSQQNKNLSETQTAMLDQSHSVVGTQKEISPVSLQVCKEEADDENLENPFPNQEDSNQFRKALEQERNNITKQNKNFSKRAPVAKNNLQFARRRKNFRR